MLVCVCVCPLEAVDLSSTPRCPVMRVLPPPRQTTLRPVVPQLSLASDYRPTLKPSTPVISCHRPVLADELPVLKHTVLPSIMDPAALNPPPPLVVNDSVLVAIPYSANSAAPHLPLPQDEQLDLRSTSTLASGEGQKSGFQTLFTGKLSAEQTPSLVGQIVLPAAISHSSAGHSTSDSQLTSGPDDLSTRRKSAEDRLTAEPQVKRSLVADDLTVEKSRQQTLQQPDNLSIEIRYKPTFVRDSLSSKQIVLPDSVAVKSKNELTPDVVEKRRERTFMADGLPARRLSLPNDLTTDLKRRETDCTLKLAVTPGECVAKPAVTSGECLVNSTDKMIIATNTSTSGTVISEWTCVLFNCLRLHMKPLHLPVVIQHNLYIVTYSISRCRDAWP